MAQNAKEFREEHFAVVVSTVNCIVWVVYTGTNAETQDMYVIFAIKDGATVNSPAS